MCRDERILDRLDGVCVCVTLHVGQVSYQQRLFQLKNFKSSVVSFGLSTVKGDEQENGKKHGSEEI